ncbi:DUF4062 domain-containing protein [Aliarcobacter butzleri]|uniref:DUF4062 domain-containing protein n=1 Tax=Aliarcobacter butzleri TaxID=28197 RepID=A0AAW6VND1_9BACT|nr:DUF4062 domain-containing protein [Aliarcobacter butzleri]MDK2061819.1 DUF4062 domain-containing protein [Aliarcobacter butzleri]
MRIFIASSGDLSNERKDLKILCYENNFTPVAWEDIDQSITKEKFQTRINEDELKESDIVIFMIKSRLGKYTEEEFRESYNELGKRIRKIYVYFFEVNMIEIDKRELRKILNLQAFLEEEGKLYTEVKDFKDLENHFLKQKEFFNKKKIHEVENLKEIKDLIEPKVDCKVNKIAILYAFPINEDYSNFISLYKIETYFMKYDLNIDLLILNLDNIYNLEDYSEIFIFAKTDKNSLIIEDDNFLSTNLNFSDLDEISKVNENVNFHLFSLNKNENDFTIFKHFNFIEFFENQTKIFSAYIYKNLRQIFKNGKAVLGRKEFSHRVHSHLAS